MKERMSNRSNAVMSLVTVTLVVSGIYICTALLLDGDFVTALWVPAAVLILYVALVMLMHKISQKAQDNYRVYEDYRELWSDLRTYGARHFKKG